MSFTSLAIEKNIYKRLAERAKAQHLSASAAARLLFEAYVSGKISIGAVGVDAPIELYELSRDEITSELQEEAMKVYNAPKDKLRNI